MREYLIGLVGLCVVISAMMALDALAQDATKDLLASQIREQGYSLPYCDQRAKGS